MSDELLREILATLKSIDERLAKPNPYLVTTPDRLTPEHEQEIRDKFERLAKAESPRQVVTVLGQTLTAENAEEIRRRLGRLSPTSAVRGALDYIDEHYGDRGVSSYDEGGTIPSGFVARRDSDLLPEPLYTREQIERAVRWLKAHYDGSCPGHQPADPAE